MSSPDVIPVPAEAPEPFTPSNLLFQAKLRHELRSWAGWLGVMGILQLVVSQLSAPWGILLLIIAGMSLVVSHTSLFIIYATTMVWAAISNFQAGQMGWIMGALLQCYFAYSIVRQYLAFRRWETSLLAAPAAEGAKPTPGTERIATVFPLAGCAASVVAAAGFFGGFLLIILLRGSSSQSMQTLYGWMLEMGINVAVLGLGLALASLVSNFRLKPVAVLGLVGSTFVLIATVVVQLLTRA